MLPNLKKEYLSIAELAKRWTRVFDEDCSEDMVIDYGKCGNINFMIIDNKCVLPAELSRLQILYPDAGGTKVYKNIKITCEQFTTIISTHRILQIKDIFGDVDGFEESEEYLSRDRYVARGSLFVSMDEVNRFEGKGDSSVEPLDPSIDVTAKDLFTQPTNSRKFQEINDSTDKFIKEYGRLPSGREELWDYLKSSYGVQNQKVILSEGHMTKDNFRRNYERWTKSSG